MSKANRINGETFVMRSCERRCVAPDGSRLRIKRSAGQAKQDRNSTLRSIEDACA